jgi:hypothetical protein
MVLVAKLSSQIDEMWLALDPVRLGSVPTGVGTPHRYVCIEDEEQAVLRADVYLGADEYACFEQTAEWRGFVLIGLGEHLHLIDVGTRGATSIPLGSYFGSLICLPECLLVASAQNVLGVEPDGRVLWTSNRVGIDGVIIDQVDDGVIDGHGEWDPPGGWRRFKLGLADGASVELEA